MYDNKKQYIRDMYPGTAIIDDCDHIADQCYKIGKAGNRTDDKGIDSFTYK